MLGLPVVNKCTPEGGNGISQTHTFPRVNIFINPIQVNAELFEILIVVSWLSPQFNLSNKRLFVISKVVNWLLLQTRVSKLINTLIPVKSEIFLPEIPKEFTLSASALLILLSPFVSTPSSISAFKKLGSGMLIFGGSFSH